jgi:hypothetical protein
MDTAAAAVVLVEVWLVVLEHAEAPALSFFDSHAPYPPMR